MKNRILGVILCVCMVFSAILISPASVNAEAVTNVALNKTAYASTALSGTLVRLTDGDTNSYTEYSSAARLDEASQWVAVDLEGSFVVSRVALCTNYDQGLPTEFTILAYNGSKWIEVYHGYGPGTVASGNRFDFEAVTCSAVKVIANRPSYRTSAGKYVFRLAELQVSGVPSDEVLSAPTTFADYTFNAAAASNGATMTTENTSDWAENFSGMQPDGYHLYSSHRAIDNTYSYNTGNGYWSGEMGEDKQYTPMGATINFSGTYRINKITLEPAYSWTAYQGGFPEDFIIEVWTQRGWETVVSREGFVPSEHTQYRYQRNFYFADVDCSAVRLTTSKNSISEGNNYGIRLGEFAAYGVESGTVIAPPAGYAAVQSEGTAFASTSRNTAGGINISALNDEVESPLWDCYSSDFFSNAEGEQYAGVAYDEAYWFNEVTIKTYAAWLPESFHISVYDGTEWVEVVRETNYAAEGTSHTFAFDDIAGSAVKFTADKMKKVARENQSGYGFEIAEMIIMGAATGRALDAPATDLFNISSGMTVTVGSIVDWTDALNNTNNLIDNDRSTIYLSNWSPTADNCEWVQITFDAPMVAHYMDFYPWAESDIPKRFPKDFKIQAYTGAEWETVLTMTDYQITEETYAGGDVNGTNTSNPFRFCFEPVECSSIRFVATELDTTSLAQQNSAYGLCLLDMNVYGENASTVIGTPYMPKRGHQGPAAVTLSKGTNNAMLNDGDRTSPDNIYTSELVESADSTVSMQLVFEQPTNVDRLLFFPEDNAKFPTEFQIYAYTAEGWRLVKDAKDYTSYVVGGFKSFSFEEICCSSIIVKMTGLSSLNGKYGVQLKDIDVIGAIGADTRAVLGDGDDDGRLNALDLPYFVQGVIEDDESQKYDFNMDNTVDVRDYVRIKVYFTSKE